MIRWLLGVTLLTTFAAGCKGSPASCTPGASARCACASSETRLQRCSADGQPGTCACGAVTAVGSAVVLDAPITAAHPARVAYLLAGHGEMTDPASIPSRTTVRERKTAELRRHLGELGYELRDLAPIELANNVPANAAVVLLLAPTAVLAPTEWAALGRYLDRGGRMLIAIDPRTSASLGSLEGRLGVKLAPGILTDDAAFLPQRSELSDHRMVITNQFSEHPSTVGLSRTVDKALVLIEAGALEVTGSNTTITIRSPATSWLDLDDNFVFDAAHETRQPRTIAVAIQAPSVPDRPGFRAAVFADVDLFADVAVMDAGNQPKAILVSGPLLDDVIRWLAGDEAGKGSQ